MLFRSSICEGVNEPEATIHSMGFIDTRTACIIIERCQENVKNFTNKINCREFIRQQSSSVCPLQVYYQFQTGPFFGCPDTDMG